MRWSEPAKADLSAPSRAATRRLTTAILVTCFTIIDLRQHARLLVVAIGGCLAILTTLASNASAQPQFDSWTTENGLPQNSVNEILQTRDGYLWLATHGGLVRFDGVRFVVFDRSTQGVESQRLRALHQDRRGTLWAATEDGLLIRYRDGRFTTYGRKDGLPNAAAARIEEDDEGNLWVTWVGSVTKYDGHRFLNLRSDHFANRVAAPPEARYLDAWWGQDSTGLHVLIKGRVRTYDVHRELLGADVTGVNSDKRDNLWIRTSNAGVIKASNGRFERYTTREGLPSNHPDGGFYEGREGDIWFVDQADRATLYRIRNGRHELIKLPGAPLSVLRSLYVDREGSTWLGTTASGLYRLREPTITVYAERDGLSLKGAYSILADSSGSIWIGGIDLKRYANGRFRSYRFAEGASRDVVTCIYEDRAGRLWVGTGGGLTHFANGQFTRYNDPSGFLNGSVSGIHEDRYGTFWFATGSGLVRSTGGRFTRYTVNDGLSHDRITALFEDRTGALWIGTFQGLTRLKDGAFTAYTEHEGFIGNAVRAIHEDNDGILWIGTYDGGLYRLAKERLTRYTRNDGLHDNGVFQILEDENGYFWMGSNRGISRVSRRELNEFAEARRRSITSVVFGPKDGLASVEVNGGSQPSGLKTADGKLWFPTMGGVAVIDPVAFRSNSWPPPAIIEEVRLAGKPIDFRKEVMVPPDAPTFEIRYTAPSFVKPEQVRFRYRLVGLDDEWIEAGDRRSAGFHGVPPRAYRFEVIAASHDGVWNTDGPYLDIVVLAPFWRTWWFIALALIGSAAIVLAGHERRVRRLRRLHALQEAFSQQLIDSQEGERRRISNELHDSLGQYLAIIKSRARAGQEKVTDREAVAEALAEIASLGERINAEMTEIAYDLRPHHLDTIGLSKTIESMVSRVGRACDIKFATDITPIDDLFPESSHIHIFRIVQEAVSNIIKHSKATHAKVAITRDATSVQIKVEDNGTGFSPEPFDAASPTKHGFGLVGIRERVRILGGRVEIQSSARTGTAVVVTFPINGTAT
jgi:signal transduction histidine kinase/ligand-binding sensor domain-containing protein